MPLVSVPAVYNGESIELLETAPVQGSYRALVTFVEPITDDDKAAGDLTRFWASFGAWQDERPVEDTLHDIHQARVSKSRPPTL